VIRFWCSACGHELSAEDKLAGRPMPCTGCGEFVDVPDNPPELEPLEYRPQREDDDDEEPAVQLPPDLAGDALRGLRQLQLSLLLFCVSFIVTSLCSGLRVQRDGIDTVLAGDYASSHSIYLFQHIAALALGVSAAVLRYRGYTACQKLARRFSHGGNVAIAAWGAAAGALGTLVATLPQLFASSPPLPGLFSTLAGTGGGMLALIGAGLEFASLGFFSQLLKRLGGSADTSRVRQYIITFGIVAAVEALATCIGYFALIFILFRPAPGGPIATGTNPGGWFAALPPETLPVLVVAGVLFLLAAMLLCWQYFSILTASRRAIFAPRIPNTPPETAP
jgi:hypothetical protein